MSDSELSDMDHGHKDLEEELRKVVRSIYASGDLEGLTVKRVRQAAEKNLDLEEGFYKQDAWKDKSKAIIESEAKNQDQPQASPPSTKKRKAEHSESPPKRQRQTGKETKAISKQVKLGKQNASPMSSNLSEPEDVSDRVSETEDKPSMKSSNPTGEASESELSELIDDEPQSKLKKKKGAKAEKPAKGKQKAASKKKTKEAPELDPDAAEIKRLQGWLIKCGIRKMWARELKDCDTPKAKVKHLREMLADAGMTGRYSVEKANQIREARELQADLEAVQEGAKYWGKQDSDEEDEAASRPRRRLAKGLQELAAFDDSESD